jgi:hypothetical protein
MRWHHSTFSGRIKYLIRCTKHIIAHPGASMLVQRVDQRLDIWRVVFHRRLLLGAIGVLFLRFL